MKVVRLPTQEVKTREQIVSFLKQVIEDVEAGRLKNLILAATNAEEEHETAMVNVDFIEAQTLISALNIDVVMWVIRENFD